MLKVAGTVLMAALLLPFAAVAQDHPHYLHALQDLRYARALLERGQGWDWGPAAADQQRATNEIQAAIEEVRHAAMDDGRNPDNHPPIDVHWAAHDRLRRAMEALDRARDSISREEINPAARDQRNRAYHHIDEARRALHHAMDNWRG